MAEYPPVLFENSNETQRLGILVLASQRQGTLGDTMPVAMVR